MTDIRTFILEQARKNNFLQKLPQVELERAVSTCFELFGASVQQHFDGIVELVIKDKQKQAVSILNEVLPALIFAHRYFGDALPLDLKKKLLNPSQTTDTCFELKCMGTFQDKHAVVYEPKLISKVPDFKITVRNNPEIYVECKTQRADQEAKYFKVFNRVANGISKTIEASTFVTSAWAQNLRTEVIPAKAIDEKETKELSSVLERILPVDCLTQRQITENVNIICIPREQPLIAESSIRHGMVRVGEKPVHMGHENTHLIVHSWTGLDSRRRKSQRNLLAEARKKLREIPKDSLGMICIQTFSARLFLPDILKLMEQSEYDRVPFVWLNPFNEGQIVCRNQYLPLRNELFENLVAETNT